MSASLLQRNIEIKARCADLDAVRTAAIERGAREAGVLMQIDTYFVLGPRPGRLKLRETKDAAGELIYYNRQDLPDVKTSDYWLVQESDAASFKAVLGAALGIRAIVRKRRELLLWQNVRIHLDQIEGLGTFLELEAVVGPDADEAESRRRVDQLMAALKVRPDDLIAGSYLEMIEAAR